MARPSEWGKNQKGMQSSGPLDLASQQNAEEIWKNSGNHALFNAELLAGIRCYGCNEIIDEDNKCSPSCPGRIKLELHKQVSNRITEPWDHITTVVTSDQFGLNNWFKLRDHKDADPTIQELARAMRKEWDNSKPFLLTCGEWHLPYVTKVGNLEDGTPYLTASTEDMEAFHKYFNEQYWFVHVWGKSIFRAPKCLEVLRKVSVGRVARVSYMRQGQGDIAANIELHDRLAKSGHWSPFEAQATPISFKFTVLEGSCDGCGKNGTKAALIPQPRCMDCAQGHITSGNFVGWRQYRKDFAGESGA